MSKNEQPDIREPLNLALKISELAEEKKADDVLILDISRLTSLADYFVIMSGATDRKTKALAKNIIDGLKDLGVKPVKVHGENIGLWVVIDYGYIIVHIFREEERKYYELERLWKDAEVVNS